MTDHGMRPRFAHEMYPPEDLFSRIRTAVAATPAPKTSTRLRITVAMAAVPIVTAAVLLVASQIVYHRPALRVDLGTHPTFQLLMVLLLVVGLTLSATIVAAGRGARGLGSGATLSPPGGTARHADLRGAHSGDPAGGKRSHRRVAGGAVAMGAALPRHRRHRGPPRPRQLHRCAPPVRPGRQPAPGSGAGRGGGRMGRPGRVPLLPDHGPSPSARRPRAADRDIHSPRPRCRSARSPPLTEARVLTPDGGRDAFARVDVTD